MLQVSPAASYYVPAVCPVQDSPRCLYQMNYHEGWTDLASNLDKDECVSRREQVSVFVSAKRKLEGRWCRVVNLACPNGEQESASMTPLCQVVQYVPHPACDGGISLGLGDKVSQQGGGAEEAQADVGGLREVSQNWRVGEVSGPRPTIDQRYHNLDNTYLLHKECFRYLIKYSNLI